MEPKNNDESTPINGVNFSQSVDIFLDSAWWLTKADQPAVTALEQCADKLDVAVRAGLLAEFTKCYRLLLNAKPDDAKETDSLDNWLAGLTA